MTDIKELALRVAKESAFQYTDGDDSGIWEFADDTNLATFAQRFLAAYLAEQKSSSEEVQEMVKRLRQATPEWLPQALYAEAADMIERLAFREKK